MKKTRITLRIILMMTISLIVGMQAKSQLNYADSLRMHYDSLDTKYFPSGILYNRSPHLLYSFKFDTLNGNWQSNPDFTSSPFMYSNGYPHFKRSVYNVLYEDMLYSSNNDTILIQQEQYDENDSVAKLNYDFPISLMRVNFHTMDLNAMKDGKITFDTVNNIYTIMPDTFWINDSIFTLIQNPDSLASTAFYESYLNAAIATRNVVYKKFNEVSVGYDSLNNALNDNQLLISYHLPKNLFISNNGKPFPNVQIDFDDGNGFVDINWDSYKNILYHDTLSESCYSKAYKKTIKVKYFNLPIDLVMSFDVNIVGMQSLADTTILTSTLPFTCTINEPNYIPSEGKVSIRFANEHIRKILKPIIVVEGFESALQDYGIISYEGVASGFIYDENDDESYEWIKEMHILFDSLHNNGYDIIYVDHKDPRTWIQSNALSVIKLIQYTNHELQNNNSNEKLVVMGASMGGLIVRYALRKMELDRCCHNTRLYATFDTPHQGANIAPGMQHFVHEMRHLSKDARRSYDEAINSPAARQMLVYHIESTASIDRNNWQSLLDSMGHPQNCRQIALISGSEIGAPYNLNSTNNELLALKIPYILPYKYIGIIPPPLHNWILKPTSTNLVDFRAFSESESIIYYGNSTSKTLENVTYSWITYGVSGTLLTIEDILIAIYPWLFPVKPITEYGAELLFDKFYLQSIELNSYTNAPYPLVYTIAPGGLSDTQKGIKKSLENKLGTGLTNFVFNNDADNHSFIPSVSALDIKTTNLYQDIRNNYLANQNITSFDCYWATNRNDKGESGNMMHVKVDQFNRAWIQEQILNDWELRASNGEYKGVLAGYYNYGRPNNLLGNDIELINKPYQSILYSLDIENNSVLYVNKQDRIGLISGSLLPRLGSTFKLKTNNELCDSTVVKIKDGGKLIVGELNNGIFNKGLVNFTANSRLEIFNNGQLIINDSSRLVIEEGATLVIHKGANIQLLGSKAILEIRGKIIIDDTASLEPYGNGFIRFAAKMNAGNMDDYWQVGSGSRLVLTSNSTAKAKKAEIVEDLFLPDSLFQIYGNVIIEFDSMVTLNSYGSIHAQNCLFIAIDSTRFYNAVKIYGQPNTRFGSCEFKFGYYGIKAQMSYGGNTFTLDSCTFTKNYVGLYTSDQYIFLNHCTLNQNIDYGWKAESMQSNCDVTHCEFDENGFGGATFNGQSNVILNVYKSTFCNNYQNGLEISEASLNSSCSRYSSNGQSGIFAKENAIVEIDGNKMNQITNNYTGILLDKALLLNIKHGFNNFMGNQYFIVGELKPDNYYQGLSTASPVDLLYNLLPAPSAMQMPINIYLTEPQFNNQISVPLINWSQNLGAYQTYCVSSVTPVNFNNYQMFEGIVSVSMLNTTHFQNIYLADAFRLAAMQVSYGESFIGNDTLAISMFKEIFDHIPANINEDERRAVDEALSLMISALTYAIERGLIDPNGALDGMPVNEYVGLIAQEIQRRLDDVEYANMYAAEQEAYYQLLLAQMYRAAEHYDYALNILQNESYFFNTTLKNQADFWNCVCMAENLLLKDEIQRPEYETMLDSCHGISTARRLAFSPIFGTSRVSTSENVNQIASIYPNPAEQYVAVEFSQRVEEVSVELSDLTGKIIWTTQQTVKGKQLRLKLPKLSSGAYMLKTTTANQVFNNKIIIR